MRDGVVRADDRGASRARADRAVDERVAGLRGGVDRDQVGPDVAHGGQPVTVEVAPHLPAEPARVELGDPGAVVGEDVDHGVGARSPRARRRRHWARAHGCSGSSGPRPEPTTEAVLRVPGSAGLVDAYGDGHASPCPRQPCGPRCRARAARSPDAAAAGRRTTSPARPRWRAATQWKDLGKQVRGNDEKTNPSALAPRWNSVVATIDYYASSAKASGCDKAVDRQKDAITALTAFGTKLAPYDMELRLEQVRDDAEAYAAAPRPPATTPSADAEGARSRRNRRSRSRPRPLTLHHQRRGEDLDQPGTGRHPAAGPGVAAGAAWSSSATPRPWPRRSRTSRSSRPRAPPGGPARQLLAQIKIALAAPRSDRRRRCSVTEPVETTRQATATPAGCARITGRRSPPSCTARRTRACRCRQRSELPRPGCDGPTRSAGQCR